MDRRDTRMSGTILISSAGRRNHLMRCFRQDAALIGSSWRVLATDMKPELSPACQEADAAFTVPRCTAPEFVPALLALCRSERVDLVIPTIDTELAVLSRHRVDFAAVGTKVVVSAPEVVALANDKLATAHRLSAAGIPSARSLSLSDYLADPSRLHWPVIAKPNAGSASMGIVRPGRPEDLMRLEARVYIVQELWQGQEYTVNLFFDAAGRLRCAVPHQRIEVRAGEVSKGITRRLPALSAAAKRLESVLGGAYGPLCFQAIVCDDGSFAVFELNARFGGGYPLAHEAGARFSEWLLQEASGRVCTANDDWQAGITMLRYDAAVFLHG